MVLAREIPLWPARALGLGGVIDGIGLTVRATASLALRGLGKVLIVFVLAVEQGAIWLGRGAIASALGAVALVRLIWRGTRLASWVIWRIISFPPRLLRRVIVGAALLLLAVLYFVASGIQRGAKALAGWLAEGFVLAAGLRGPSGARHRPAGGVAHRGDNAPDLARRHLRGPRDLVRDQFDRRPAHLARGVRRRLRRAGRRGIHGFGLLEWNTMALACPLASGQDGARRVLVGRLLDGGARRA